MFLVDVIFFRSHALAEPHSFGEIALIESEYRLMCSTLHRNPMQYEVASRCSTVAHTPKKTAQRW